MRRRLLVLLLYLATHVEANCVMVADLATSGRACSRGSQCTTLDGLCSTRGQCTLNDQALNDWSCARCVSASAFDSHCAEVFPASSAPAGPNQREFEHIAGVIGAIVRYPAPLRPPEAGEIILPIENTSDPIARAGNLRAPRYVAWLGSRPELSVAAYLPVMGLPFDGHTLLETFYLSPRRVVFNASSTFQRNHYGSDDGTSIAPHIQIEMPTAMRNSLQLLTPFDGHAEISPRPIAYRHWPKRAGPAAEPRSAAIGRPAVAMSRLPAFDNNLLSDARWENVRGARRRHIAPGYPRISVANSSFVAAALLNRRHGVLAAGSASQGYLMPAVPPIDDFDVPNYAVIAGVSGAYVDPFDTSGTSGERGHEGLHPAHDSSQAVVETAVVADVATVWYLLNGQVRVVPLVNESGEVLRPSAVQTLRGFMTASHKVTTFGRKSVVYREGDRNIYPFGVNADGMFAHGDASAFELFDGTSVDLSSGLEPFDGIRHVSISERHMVVTSSSGRVYFAGSTRESDAACFGFNATEGDSAVLSAIRQINVTKAVAGVEFTLFWFDQTNPFVSHNLYVCGGRGYMIKQAVTQSPIDFTQKFRTSSDLPLVNVCSGSHYACLHRSDGKLVCWGSQKPVSMSTGNVAYRLVCSTEIPFWESTETRMAVYDAETVSCGDTHVIFTQVDDGAGASATIGPSNLELLHRNQTLLRARLDATGYRTVRSCGSNRHGQLGRSSDLSDDISDARPIILGVPDTVATAFEANLVPPDVEAQPLHRVTGAAAIGNNTVVLTQERRFSSPASVKRTFANAMKQKPPSGLYRLDTSRYGDRDCLLDFDTLPGTSLLVAGNVSGTWLAPQTNDLFMLESRSLITGARGSFQRGLQGLNESSSVDESFDNVTRRFYRAVTVTTIHFVIIADGGYVRNSTDERLSRCGNALCDSAFDPPRVVWAPSGSSFPSQFSWVALGVWSDTLRFNSSAYIAPSAREAAFFATTGANQSAATMSQFLPRWSQYETFEEDLRQRRSELYCVPSTTVLECTAATWFEGWANSDRGRRKEHTALSSAGRIGWPVGGAVPSIDARPVSDSVNVLNLRAPSFTPAAMRATDRPRGLSEDNIGLVDNACHFLRVGALWFYVRFLSSSVLQVCSFGGVSRTASATIEPVTTAPPSPPAPAGLPQQRPQATWSMSGPDIMRILNLGLHTGTSERYVNNITLDLSCSGGVQLPDGGANLNVDQSLNTYDLSVFLLFSNDSIGDEFAEDPGWFLRDTVDTTLDSSAVLDFRSVGPLGCDIGYVTHPLEGSVSFSRLAFSFRVGTNFPTSSDVVIVELIGPGDVQAGVRFRFEFAWRSVSVFDIRSGRGRRTRVTESAFPCSFEPLRVGSFNEYVLDFDPDTSETALLQNGELLCTGTLLGATDLERLHGVYVGLMNRNTRTTTPVSFREIVACDMRTPYASVYGCRIARNSYDVAPRTETKSLEPTTTVSLELTDSQSVSESTTLSTSTSLSSTGSNSVSESLVPTATETLPLTGSTSISVSVTETVSMSGESATATESDIPFRHLYLRDYNEDISTTTLLRRTGLQLKLSVAGDYFNFHENWPERAAGMLVLNSSVSADDNANGMAALLHKEGFVSGAVSENRSEIVLQFGPYDQYHSLADEVIELAILPAGFATYMESPNSITFRIPGPGPQVSAAVASLEAAAFGAAVVGTLMGSSPSMVTAVTRNSILLNYQCFGSERTRISYLLHPLQLTIAGSDALAMFVFHASLCVAIVTVHLLVTLVLRLMKPQLHVSQAMGYVAFPSLTIVLCTAPGAGGVWGAFRSGFQGDLNVAMLLIPATSILAVGGSLAYLYSVLYDESNFCAVFVPYSDEVMNIRRRNQPISDLFSLPGWWESNDRKMSFVDRLWFCFWEYNDRRRYFVTVELLSLFMEAVVLGVPGSGRSLCVAQLFVVLMLRVATLAAVLLMRPHNTRAGLPIATVVCVIQVLTALVYAVYVTANFTNTLRSVMRSTLFAATGLILVIALVSAVFFARIRCLAVVYNRQVAKSAKRAYRPGRADDEQRDVEGALEQPLAESVQTGSPAAVARANDDDAPLQDLDFTRTDVLPAETKKAPASDTDSDVVFGGPVRSFSASNSLQDGHLPEHPPPAGANPKPPPGPAVWRVIALEEALDKQCDDIDVFDDDLL